MDTTFNYMDIESDICRLKTICEMESYAANNPIARLAINTVKCERLFFFSQILYFPYLQLQPERIREVQ